MSLKTWKKEFYPVDAQDATSSESEALEHSLLKWTGLLPRNRKKHGCILMDQGLYWDRGPAVECLHVSRGTCALCCRLDEDCSGCPLDPCQIEPDSPYYKFVHTGAVVPMIKHIKAAIKKQSD